MEFPAGSRENNVDKIFIIAEAGVNHNGSLKMAKKMIDTAVSAGVDAVKFQIFDPDEMVRRDAPKAEYQKSTGGKNQYEMLKKLALNNEAFTILAAYCRKRGLQFLASPFDEKSVDLMEELKVPIYKVASGEITNLLLLRKIGALGKRVILSTGMATTEEISEALRILIKAGTSKKNITLLHCTTAYPAPVEEVNLRAIPELGRKFGLKVGYSDHTLGIEAAVAAAALGATVIEKHFTLDKRMSGPDHKASLDPQELNAMVKALRNIEKALGNGSKKPTPAELKIRKIARKSIVARTIIRKGDRFSAENITVKRPGSGLSPLLWDRIIGRQAARSYKRDQVIVNEGGIG
jgi:N,N'-diacetyllegionaminate synthase